MSKIYLLILVIIAMVEYLWTSSIAQQFTKPFIYLPNGTAVSLRTMLSSSRPFFFFFLQNVHWKSCIKFGLLSNFAPPVSFSLKPLSLLNTRDGKQTPQSRNQPITSANKPLNIKRLCHRLLHITETSSHSILVNGHLVSDHLKLQRCWTRRFMARPWSCSHCCLSTITNFWPLHVLWSCDHHLWSSMLVSNKQSQKEV